MWTNLRHMYQYPYSVYELIHVGSILEVETLKCFIILKMQLVHILLGKHFRYLLTSKYTVICKHI